MTTGASRFLRLAALGGTIVSSNSLSSRAIAVARAADRLFVDDDGYGYVYRPGPRDVVGDILFRLLVSAVDMLSHPPSEDPDVESRNRDIWQYARLIVGRTGDGWDSDACERGRLLFDDTAPEARAAEVNLDRFSEMAGRVYTDIALLSPHDAAGRTAAIESALRAAYDRGATVTGGDGATVTGGYRATVTGGDGATVTGGHCSRVTGGDDAAVTGGNDATVTGGDRATVTGGDGATVKGGEGAVLSICHYDDQRRKRIVVAYVGENGIKPNTPYRLVGGVFAEVPEEK